MQLAHRQCLRITTYLTVVVQYDKIHGIGLRFLSRFFGMYLKKSTGLQTQSFSSLVLCDVTGNISLFCMCGQRRPRTFSRLEPSQEISFSSSYSDFFGFQEEKKLKQLFYGQCFFHLKICKSWDFELCLLSSIITQTKKAHKYESSWSPFFAQRSFPLQVLSRLVAQKRSEKEATKL